MKTAKKSSTLEDGVFDSREQTPNNRGEENVQQCKDAHQDLLQLCGVEHDVRLRRQRRQLYYLTLRSDTVTVQLLKTAAKSSTLEDDEKDGSTLDQLTPTEQKRGA